MRPLTVITGIVLGTSVSIAVSLAAVIIMFVFLGDDYPRVVDEFPGVVVSFGIFLLMTAVCAMSFWTLLKGRPARHLWQGLMWAGVAAVGLYYWP